VFCLLLVASLMNMPSERSVEGEIIRDAYGIPHVFSKSLEQAFFHAGYAVAQDRLFQMELSRRLAQGRLSEILGRKSLNSDKDALRFGYTESEYLEFYERLSPKTKTMLDSYARGVNAWIEEAARTGKLPKDFLGSKPTPWKATDSLAIAVNLTRLFGRGGAGEIRNFILFSYLKERLGEEVFDAVNDLAWQNDSASIPTCSREDDPFRGKSPFEEPNEKVLEEHAKLLPKANLLELLPGIRLAEQADMMEIASKLGLTHQWGSFAVLVSPRKSAFGVPILMNGPQMGFHVPSVIHQMSIACPEYTAVGMDLPGIPGILVGHSPYAAWGVTSGIADTDDIFFVRLNPKDSSEYEFKGKWVKFETEIFPIRILGEGETTGTRELSIYGPVILKSPSTGVAYVRKSTLWKAEAEIVDYVYDVAQAKKLDEFRNLAKRFNASSNLFVATKGGDIAWFYCGRVPLRSKNIDFRLPTPGDGKHDWRGVLPPEKMPYMINPKSGFIVNWNNKPVEWWLNFDTPAWGRIFRHELLLEYLRPKKKITVTDLEELAERIATYKSEPRYFVPELLDNLQEDKNGSEVFRNAKAHLESWDYNFREGSVAPTIYEAWLDALRTEIFREKLGGMISPEIFRIVIQPTLLWNALHGKSKIHYLGERKREEVMQTSFVKALETLQHTRGEEVNGWRYRAPRVRWGNLPEMLYDERATYLQIVELWETPRGRFVAPPGVSENPSSPHFQDQISLAASWGFCPMLWKREDFR